MKTRAFKRLLSQIEKLTPNQEKQLQNQFYRSQPEVGNAYKMGVY